MNAKRGMAKRSVSGRARRFGILCPSRVPFALGCQKHDEKSVLDEPSRVVMPLQSLMGKADTDEAVMPSARVR